MKKNSTPRRTDSRFISLGLSIIVIVSSPTPVAAQTVQLHYDLRHTINSRLNPKNFPTLYFEYWKGTDSTSSLAKIQADLLDENSNTGKIYLQLAHSFRIWRKLQLHLSYSGGVGVTIPREYSFSITNTFQVGLTFPFQWQGAYWSVVLDSKFIPYAIPSLDPIFTLYWYRGLAGYRLELSGDFSVWTENRDHGDALTRDLKGKRFSFFAEPQVWLRIFRQTFIGTRVNCFYHVLRAENLLEIYPGVGIRSRF